MRQYPLYPLMILYITFPSTSLDQPSTLHNDSPIKSSVVMVGEKTARIWCERKAAGSDERTNFFSLNYNRALHSQLSLIQEELAVK